MKRKRSFLYYLSNIDIILAGIGLVFLVLLTLAGALFRYFLDSPFTWMEEVQLMLEVWVVFLGAGYGFRVGAHVSVEILVDALPESARKAVDLLVAAIVVGTLSYLLYQSVGYADLFIQNGRVSSYLGIPYVYVYGIMPICCALMIANFVYVVAKKIKGVDVTKETEAA